MEAIEGERERYIYTIKSVFALQRAVDANHQLVTPVSLSLS